MVIVALFVIIKNGLRIRQTFKIGRKSLAVSRRCCSPLVFTGSRTSSLLNFQRPVFGTSRALCAIVQLNLVVCGPNLHIGTAKGSSIFACIIGASLSKGKIVGFASASSVVTSSALLTDCITNCRPATIVCSRFSNERILQLHVGSSGRADFGSLGLSNHAEQFRYCDGGQDAHDHDHDHQFDKGKTLLFHSVLLVVLLHTFLSFSPVSGVQLVYVLNIQSFFPKSNRFVKIFCIFVKLFSRFRHIFVTKNYFVLNRRVPDLPFLVEIRHISRQISMVYIYKNFGQMGNFFQKKYSNLE